MSTPPGPTHVSRRYTHADSDTPTRLAARVAATTATLASVNATLLRDPDLCDSLQRALTLLAKADTSSADVRRALYTSLAQTFTRIRDSRDADADRLHALDPTALKTLLFTAYTNVEAARMLRADALVSMRTASTSLWGKLQEEVGALAAEEVSPAVRERLGGAVRGPMQ